MKIFLTGFAAVSMASAAFAQTTTPVGPAAPTTTESAPAAAAPSADPAAPAAAPEATAQGAPALVERNGKWWNGDKKATKPEIAAWKSKQKAGAPN